MHRNFAALLHDLCYTQSPPMMLSRRPLLLATLGATLGGAAALLIGCGPSRDEPPELAANAGLPPWVGEYQQLYDDQIDPASLGLSMSGRSPADNPLLPLRAQSADIVARVRVQTITRGTIGTRTNYVMAVQVGEPTLMPPRTDTRTFELEIGPTSNSFGIVQSMESSLRGHIFVGFIKRFAGQEGPDVHYHLTSDNPEVHKAVTQVGLLEELSKQ